MNANDVKNIAIGALVGVAAVDVVSGGAVHRAVLRKVHGDPLLEPGDDCECCCYEELDDRLSSLESKLTFKSTPTE